MCMRAVNADLGVAAVVIKNSKILLVQEARGTHIGQWGLPKGYVEHGELPADAVLRELREECGIHGTVEGICGIRECLRNGLVRLFIAYKIHSEHDSLMIDVDEISNAKYVSEFIGSPLRTSKLSIPRKSKSIKAFSVSS